MKDDPLLVNKILAAVLAALLIATLSAFAADLIYGTKHNSQTEEVKLNLVDIQDENSSSQTIEADTIEPIESLLANANIEHGKNIARKCSACHTFTPSGANRVGPNLWQITGRKVATVQGFKYSTAMKNFGGIWGDDRLNSFIAKPKNAVKGTKMNFVGIKKAQDRADIIAWLKTLR